MRFMTAEGNVTRTLLSLPPLHFGNGNPSATYNIQISRNGWGPGEASMRRITAQSPYYKGRYLVRAVEDHQTSILNLRVKGEDQENLYAAINELVAAFTQQSYDLTLNINGNIWVYENCEPADYVLGDGGQIDDLMARSNTQNLSFSIPHFPVDSGGWDGSGTYPVIE